MQNDKSSDTPRPQSGSVDPKNPRVAFENLIPGLEIEENPDLTVKFEPFLPRLDEQDNPDLIGNFGP